MNRRVPRCRLRVAAAALVIALAACSDGAGVDAFCSEAAELQRIDRSLLDVNPADKAAVLDALEDTAEQFAAVADAAPDDVAPDVQLLADFNQGLLDAVSGTDPRDTFALADAMLRAQRDAGDIESASARYRQHVARLCAPAP